MKGRALLRGEPGRPGEAAVRARLLNVTSGSYRVEGCADAAVDRDPPAKLRQGTVEAPIENTRSPQGAKLAPAGPVTMPEGDGAPVITDGIFSPGEWDDALRIALNETVPPFLKHYRGVVFAGVRGQGSGIGPSELFLAAPGGAIHRLHVSAQLCEAAVPPSGAGSRTRFGLTGEWHANELRRDEEESARLQKEGKSPIEIIRATSYPNDGLEFAIRRSKFTGPRRLMRLWASAMVGGKPGMLTQCP